LQHQLDRNQRRKQCQAAALRGKIDAEDAAEVAQWRRHSISFGVKEFSEFNTATRALHPPSDGDAATIGPMSDAGAIAAGYNAILIRITNVFRELLVRLASRSYADPECFL
jgi:hypothetical protein